MKIDKNKNKNQILGRGPLPRARYPRRHRPRFVVVVSGGERERERLSVVIKINNKRDKKTKLTVRGGQRARDGPLPLACHPPSSSSSRRLAVSSSRHLTVSPSHRLAFLSLVAVGGRGEGGGPSSCL